MLQAAAEESSEPEVTSPQENPASLLPDEPASEAAEAEQSAEEEIPAWLAHVRQRAQTEGDARGLYNRPSTPASPIKPDRSESPDQPFNDWVGRVHENQTAGEAEKTDKDADEMPVWLKRVRDLQLQPDEKDQQKPEGLEAWKEEWSEEDLERLKNGEFDEKAFSQPSLLDQPTQDEIAGPSPQQTAESTKQPEAAREEKEPAAEEAEPVESPESPEASLAAAIPEDAARESDQAEIAQTEVLEEIVAAETQARYEKKAEKTRKTDIWRWIGVIFLLAMLLAFYLLFLNQPAPAPLSGAADTAFWNQLQDFPEDGKVLMVLDYQPATAEEMQANLAPVLEVLKKQNARLSVLAMWPDGLWLGRELLEAEELASSAELSFLPGGNLAMLAGAAGLQLAGGAKTGIAGNFPGADSLDKMEYILYAGDNPGSVKTWIEQVGSFLPPEKKLIVATQAARVMLEPYYEAGQISGLSTSPFYPDGNLKAGALPASATPAFEAGMGVMAAYLVLSFLGRVAKTGKNDSAGEMKL